MARTNSRALHYVGKSDVNPSGTSSKYYVIGARENVVHIFHGPCDVVKGRIKPRQYIKQGREFSSAAEAAAFVRATVNKKTSRPNEQYKVTPPPMRPALDVFGDKPARKYSKKRITVGTLLKQIAQIEKATVHMLLDGRRVRSDRTAMASYNSLYERQFAGTGTAADLERRLQRCFPEFTFEVLKGDGTVAARNTKLLTIRNSYRKIG